MAAATVAGRAALVAVALVAVLGRSRRCDAWSPATSRRQYAAANANPCRLDGSSTPACQYRRTMSVVRPALSHDDDGDGSDGDSGGDDGGGGEESNVERQRRRKRDVLKRTLGLGGGSSDAGSSDDGGGNASDVVKLNTEGLFAGMPSVSDMLGGGGGGSPPLPLGEFDGYDAADANINTNPGVSPASAASSSTNNDGDESFRRVGRATEPNLLTPQDMANLDAKYDELRRRSEEEVLESERKGGGDGPDAISEEEARKIVDYTVAEEKSAEKRELDAQRKGELLQQWEDDAREREREIDAQNAEGGAERIEEMLRRDAVSREIIENADARDAADEERESKVRELEFYKSQLMQRREVEERQGGSVEGGLDEDVDIDDLYEESLSRVASSRSTLLGPSTLGVLANSIALEEGRQYVENKKREKEFLSEVESEVRSLGVTSDEEVEKFFRAPADLSEERMYRSILRQIVDNREGAPPPETSVMDALSATENDSEDDGIPVLPEEVDPKAKYKLSAKETVKAYQLLNLWRDMQAEQNAMEEVFGMRDNPQQSTRPTNKLEPFFLYQEDSEEKRLKGKEQLSKILTKILESADPAEKSSNELLIRELLGDEGSGNVDMTKDRAVRLLDKLLNKAKSGTIKDSLMDTKKLIMQDDDESTGVGGDVTMSGPLDLSGVFETLDTIDEEEQDFNRATAPKKSTEPPSGGRTMPSWVSEQTENREIASPPPPNTPFFSSYSSEDLPENVADKPPPPPNTAFFQSSDTSEKESDNSSPTGAGGLLGTYEEQRLKLLANRVGAQSEEDIEELRRNMEELKNAEEMASAQLSGDSFDAEAASAKYGIDMDSLNLEDEDDDQIMSIIGKRPVSSRQNKVVVELNEDTESDGIIVDAAGNLKRMDRSGEQSKPDIADAIFRSQTGGKYQDRETRDADEAAFKDFLRLEEETEKKFEESPPPPSQDIDIDSYAEDVMSEMKPRPRRAKMEDVMSVEDLYKERKKESIFGDNDPFPVRKDPRPTASSDGGDAMPEWYRKEQEAKGINVDDLDEDDFDDARREWEREERQRKADEYLKNRGEGISISDVLGREYFGPMDEPDDTDERSRPSLDGYYARKELLLEYTELTAEDVINVVEYKVDPLSTGYNQYLRKVQDQYSEYGAIFRLEGVLVDMIGLHGKAWKKVAELHNYNIESSDEVRQASLYKPEGAIREVFYWTDDVVLVTEIAHTFREAFQEAFDEWVDSGSNVATASAEGEASSTNEDTLPQQKSTPTTEEMSSMYYLCWSKLANNLDRTAPTRDEVYRGFLSGDWEYAINEIFPQEWRSEDPDEVYNTVVAYDEIMQADYRILLQKYGIDIDEEYAAEEEDVYGLNFPDVSWKEDIQDWLNMLGEVGMPCAVVSHLDSSQLASILDASGLAEYFPPDKRVSSECYANERSELLGAALRIEQKPDKCVVFDNTPHSAKEAHEVYMKSISFVDHYARYELLTSDLSVGYARDLDLLSLAKLFDERTDNELELDVDSGMERPQIKRKTAYWDD